MSLLSAPAKPTADQARAAKALALPRITFNRLLAAWRDGVESVWGAPNPADVLTAMGTQAGELFQRSSQLQAFLEAQNPGSTNIPAAAKIKPVNINVDGTVTLKN